MPVSIIEALPSFSRRTARSETTLNIAEMFSDTVQGEGISSGVVSTFMRLQHCTLNCKWCDTTEVWRQGNPYTIDEVLSLFEKYGLIEKFSAKQHLILTGGSPLKQQQALEILIQTFSLVYNFKPFIEVENEAVLMPSEFMVQNVNQWNNSPKLANSGMRESVRYKPEVLRKMSSLKNSWFKFVIDSESDWDEIQNYYLNLDLIRKPQIILMPKGQTREELQQTRELTVELAIKHNVRFSDRLHVTIWDKKTGV